MKKHWKKIILVLGVIFLCVAGYLVYLFQFKEYDVADEQVDEITKENYEIELPDGSKIIVDGDGNVIEQPSEATGDAESKDSDADSTEENSAGSTNSEGGSSAEGSTSSGTAGTSSSNNGTASSGSSNDGSDKATGTSGSGSASGNTGSGSSNSGKETTTGGSGNSGSGNSGSGNSGSGSDKGAGTVTVAQIKQKYEPSLSDIENQANARINGLVGRAKSEYNAKKANGESISYGYFYNKYMSAATELEGRTDTVFYAVLGSMKKELKANGLAESHADSLVSEYEARKEQRKSDLISKATGL